MKCISLDVFDMLLKESRALSEYGIMFNKCTFETYEFMEYLLLNFNNVLMLVENGDIILELPNDRKHVVRIINNKAPSRHVDEQIKVKLLFLIRLVINIHNFIHDKKSLKAQISIDCKIEKINNQIEKINEQIEKISEQIDKTYEKTEKINRLYVTLEDRLMLLTNLIDLKNGSNVVDLLSGTRIAE